MLRSNVFCGNYGVTTLEEGFVVHDDAPYGIILRGNCEKCGGEKIIISILKEER